METKENVNEAMPVDKKGQRTEKMKGLIEEAAGLVENKKEEAFIALCDMDGKQTIALNGSKFSLAAIIAQAMDESPDFRKVIQLALFARQAKWLGIHGEEHSDEENEA